MIIFSQSFDTEPSDQEFMVDLYKRFGRLMFSVVRKYVHSPEACEDIMQDAIVKLIEKVSLLRRLDGCILASYIVSTVRNTSINYLRRKAVQKRLIDPIEELSDETIASPQSMEEIMSAMENRDLLLSIWDSLSEEDQFILEGKYFLGYSDKELAEMLGCKQNSIRMKLTRARRRVMTELTNRGYQHEK